MKQVFSPKQVATAIGASESSVKRWCDQGVIPSIKTAGGHRRVPISGVLEFVRSDNRGLIDPAAIGLPTGIGDPTASNNQVAAFKQYLVAGDYNGCRRVAFQLFLDRQPLAQIFDEVFAKTMHELGEDWCSGRIEVFEERRGCELATRLMYDLRATLALPPADAPLAMGGSTEDDPYSLPTRMVEMVLVEHGWNAMSLGSGIPVSSMIEAVKKHKPRLFWLSVSALEDSDQFLAQYQQLSEACGTQTALVVGGRGLTDQLREQMKYTAYCESLIRLESFAQAIHSTTESK